MVSSGIEPGPLDHSCHGNYLYITALYADIARNSELTDDWIAEAGSADPLHIVCKWMPFSYKGRDVCPGAVPPPSPDGIIFEAEQGQMHPISEILSQGG
jgi:hypothetical protein